MVYVVQPGQTFINCVIQMAGTLDAAADIALANGIAVGDDVEAGQELVYPDVYTRNEDVLRALKAFSLTVGNKSDI